jgi:phytoene dehydrogenase-like protein
MKQVFQSLRAYIRENGGEVEYKDLIAQINVGNRAAVVDRLRGEFRFRLVATPEGMKHLVSEE